MSRGRRWWILHRRVGIVAALLALIVALSGIGLLFRDSLRQPRPQATPTAAPLPLEALVARAVAYGGGAPATDIALPGEPTAPYVIWLDDDAETEVFLDGRGEVLGARPGDQGLTRILFKIHTGEFLGSVGWGLAGLTGLALIFLTLTGLGMASRTWRRGRRRP